MKEAQQEAEIDRMQVYLARLRHCVHTRHADLTREETAAANRAWQALQKPIEDEWTAE